MRTPPVIRRTSGGRRSGSTPESASAARRPGLGCVGLAAPSSVVPVLAQIVVRVIVVFLVVVILLDRNGRGGGGAAGAGGGAGWFVPGDGPGREPPPPPPPPPSLAAIIVGLSLGAGLGAGTGAAGALARRGSRLGDGRLGAGSVVVLAVGRRRVALGPPVALGRASPPFSGGGRLAGSARFDRAARGNRAAGRAAPAALPTASTRRSTRVSLTPGIAPPSEPRLEPRQARLRQRAEDRLQRGVEVRGVRAARGIALEAEHDQRGQLVGRAVGPARLLAQLWPALRRRRSACVRADRMAGRRSPP